jgi:hypothetical protein
LNYKKGLISFCETGEYSLYTDYFLLNKQIERIKEIEEKKSSSQNTTLIS